jgi:glucosamine 6-phosphate synthetase-like amidotransferase/phosphosugar isomerase protein
MCGIGAFHVQGDEFDAGRCARILLRLLEVRGRDASGVAWHQPVSEDVETFILKGNISGSELAKQIQPGQIGSTGIVHTRWATKGDPSNNLNNHPIDVSGIVGVHNGHVSNDDELFKKIGKEFYSRQGQVDSEAAFAWLAHGDTELSIFKRMAEIRGNAALLWLDTSDRRQRLHAARLTSSPLVLGQMKGGSVICASTQAILDETAKRLNVSFEFCYSFKEGEYAVIENGRISEFMDVPMPRSYSSSYSHSTATSSYQAASLFEKGGK